MLLSQGGRFNKCWGKGVLQPEAESDVSRDHVCAYFLLLILQRNLLSVCYSGVQFIEEKSKEAQKHHGYCGKECSACRQLGTECSTAWVLGPEADLAGEWEAVVAVGFRPRSSHAFVADLLRSRDFQVGRSYVITNSSSLLLSGHYPGFTHNYSGNDRLTSRVRAWRKLVIVVIERIFIFKTV